jgi:integrase
MRGHIRKRGSKWCVVLDNGRDPESGKRRQKWVSGFRTGREAEDVLVDLLGQRKLGLTIDPDLTPTADYLAAWLEGRVGKLAPLSVTQYRSVIKNHIRDTGLGRMPLGKVRRAHIRAHAAELERKGLAESTRHTVHAVLSRGFADAFDDELISLDPTIRKAGRRESTSQTPTKRITVWTAEELRQLLDAAVSDRLEALWRLAVASGARRGELLGTTWLGFSTEAGTLTISQQVTPTRGGVTIAPCKTKGSHRTISLDDDTVAALEEHRERQLAGRELAGDAYVDRDLIFCDELGNPINPQRMTEWFGTLRAKAAIRTGRLHDVRHSHATHLLTSGIPVHIVAARLGHSSPVVTLTTYAHVLPTSDEQAAAAIAAVLAG